MPIMRIDRRDHAQERPLTIVRKFTKYAPGSVLISFGETKVLCTATIDEKVPPFLKESQKGWVTAEYSMLPGATHTRSVREVKRGHQSGRTTEIQRLIGRSLRSVIDGKKLGERTITVDCDVLQADGGTRTAAITGGMIAMWDAVQYLLSEHKIRQNPITEFLAAVSVGIVDDQIMVDLCYDEDVRAQVDMNVVITQSGALVEVQGTGEERPFSRHQFDAMLDAATVSVGRLIAAARESVGELTVA
jgi:ribonuclease PH